MMTFTDLVLDLKVRYQFGWVLVALILCVMVTFNLIVIIYKTIMTTKRSIRLKITKKRNYKLQQEKNRIKIKIRKYMKFITTKN